MGMARSFRHSFREWPLPYETATASERPFRPLGVDFGRSSKSWRRGVRRTGCVLKGPDARQWVCHFVTHSSVVVPVKFAGIFSPRQLVRTVAVGLVLRQPAFAKPDFLAFDDVAGRLLQRALHYPCHLGFLRVVRFEYTRFAWALARRIRA